MPPIRIAETAKTGSLLWALLAIGSADTSTWAATLPVPCATAACGPNGPQTWVTSGTARLVQAGNSLTINQSSANAIYNWQSFNISADGTVTFNQPSAASVALNQIFQADPSKILGALNANGSIYLINQNGIIFGSGAQVNVGSLIASSLNITPAAIAGILNASQTQSPAFSSFLDANGQPLPSGAVQVASGATIKAPNGEIMLFGSSVTNQGSLQANGGQVILAAGDSVYLAPSTDPSLRGLLVEVGKGGTVTNAGPSTPGGTDAGQISANQGDVTLVGLIVNQSGRITATTSVRQNGSIHLLAQDGGFATPGENSATLGASHSGTLTLGSDSHTDVLLDLADTGTAVDATAQPKSQVTLNGNQVWLQSGSEITATSGNVAITAAAVPGQSPAAYAATPGTGRLLIDSNASIDVSGANVTQSMESNVIQVQLRGTELADSPLQRNGALRGATVSIDTRESGVLNGVAWEGSPIGNLSGYVATVARDVSQRNLTGGTITLNSDGAVFVAPTANLNISGGSTTFLPGYINTTKVLGTNGIVYDISQADPNQTYVGIVSGYTVGDSKWGTTQAFPTFSADPRGTFEPGYVQGNDAGTVSIAAPRLVLDGNIQTATVVGPFQRQMPTGFDNTVSQYRPINQVPLSGALILGSSGGDAGNNFLLPDVTFASGTVLNTLSGPNGAAFDPLNDPLPTSLDTFQLRPELLGTSGIGRLTLFANGTVTVPQNVSLQMPAAGQLAMTAGAINFEGSVKAPDGAVTLTATPSQTLLLSDSGSSALPALTLGSNAVIDVSGQWVNDLPLGSSVTGTAPLAVNGGSVTLSAASGALLDLSAGSLIDASGGAQRTSAGKIVGGIGGSIAISAAPSSGQSVATSIGSTLQDYGLQHGGSLALTANEICIAASNCAATGDKGLVWLTPQLFTDDGFGSISLTSNLAGLQLLPGTQVAPSQINYSLSSNAFGAATGTSMGSIATLALLPDYARTAVNVSLASKATPAPNFAFDSTTIGLAGVLDIGSGASIVLDAGGTLNLTSDTAIDIAGRLVAPGGNVAVKTTTNLPLLDFIASQGIWLEDGALISTQGTALLQRDNLGRTTGSILGGGNISITADRGYIVTDSNSELNASGSAAQVNLPQSMAVNGVISNAPTLVGSNGGSISLTASEGMLLNGAATAAAGNAAGTVGGTLSITLDGNLHGPEPSLTPIFPFSPRNIVVSNGSPVIVAPQTAVPDQYNGMALVPETLLQNGGFSGITLTARNLFDGDGPVASGAPVSTASITFAQNTSLQLPTSIRLDAPQIVSQGGAQIQLSAPYIGLGYDDTAPGAQAGATVNAGTGSLQVQGSLIDFFGSLGLSGISNTKISSAGDVRFIGIQSSDQLNIVGTLQTQGDLIFQAAQLYPTTLSQFSIVDQGAAANTITILPGANAAPVLSAGGSLTLQADAIQQGGVLRAPFGQLALDAANITLQTGSITSVSGAGQLIPFGLTQAGADWVYALPGGQVKIYTQSGPPAKAIQLNGNSITVAQGATVDLSGGGDLQASEFVPGVGGTIDVLSNTVNPTQFAIVPVLGSAFAPYDSQAQTGFAYSSTTRVYLDGGAGVPAGEYAVLPAAYALLPGAYLVKPVASGFAGIAPGQVFAQADGSSVIAGQFTVAGATSLSPINQGFNIRPGSAVQNLGQYTVTSADTFFTQQASAANTAPPRLPVDAGQLQFLAGQQLQFLGNLSVAPASGGRGAEVDISASQIEITNGNSAPVAGTVELNAAQLNTLGAASLLLGGTRSDTGGTSNITTTATSLTVDGDVSLSGTEILLAAQNSLTLDAGAKLSASGAGVSVPAEYDLTGGGALLRVSTGGQVPIARGQLDGASGALSIAQGAVLQSSGSATLEASGQMTSQATYLLSGGSLAFSASSIALSADGSAGAGNSSLQLSTSELSALNLSGLGLTSTSSIDVFGGNTLTAAGNVLLNASAIDARTADAGLALKANQITLQGTSAPPAGPGTTSSGAIDLQANQILLSGGQMSLSGFSAATLGGASQIRAMGTGSLNADAPLTLTTAQLATSAGATYQISSSGSLAVLGATPAGNSAAPAAPGAGGALDLSGANISVNTAIAMPSGLLSLAAQGPNASDGITLSSSASIDVSGISETFDSMVVSGPGGHVDLISAMGGITMVAGSKINLSAAGTSTAAGQLNLSVPNGQIDLGGTLLATGGAGATAGGFSVDAATLPDLGALNASLNAGSFGGSRSFYQHGPGDVVVPVSTSINASTVSISNDGGSVNVLGQINAAGASGGSVTLTALNAVDIEGSILASASSAGQSGGSLNITSTSGSVRIGDGATIDLSGGAGASGGILALSVPRSALTNLVTGNGPVSISLGGTIVGASQVRAEGVATYTVAGNTISADDVLADPSNPIYADASNFMSGSAGIGAALKGGTNLNVSVVPGIEIDATGDLTLGSAWDLSTWRFNGAPGILTLRASGNLLVNNSLSDGFSGVSGAQAFVLPTAPDQSWSYRLVAGANLGASNVMAVQSSAALAGSGNLEIAAGSSDLGRDPPTSPVMIRTGTGSIDIATGGNLVFGNRTSEIYTAGQNSDAGIPLSQLADLAYPTAGGNININVAGDIAGAPTNQLITSWLWRSGQAAGSASAGAATGWTVNYAWFEENIGALAGGNINIKAGGNISELSVALPSIGVQTGGSDIAHSQLQITGGGNLTVQSGGDITGGSYFVGLGSGRLESWGAVGVGTATASNPNPSGFAPVLSVGDASMSVTARAGLQLEGIANSFLLPQGISQPTPLGTPSVFSTYTDASAINLVSTAGDVTLTNTPELGLEGELSSMRGSDLDSAFHAYPGTLNAAALSGNLNFGGNSGITLWPASHGNLNLLAAQNVIFAPGASLIMSGLDPASLPNPNNPAKTSNLLYTALLAAPLPGVAYTPIHSSAFTGDAENDPNPVRIVAAAGDVSNADILYVPKPIHIVAGQDVTDLTLRATNLGAGDLSVISAGRDLTYAFPRDPLNGDLLAATQSIVIEGPGSLLVEAGRNVNLGTSFGITTVGNLYNPSLPAGGADVSVMAGATVANADLSSFITDYLVNSDLYDSLLMGFVQTRTSGPLATKAAALTAFEALPSDQQFLLSQQILFNEIRTGGRAAAAAGATHNDYARSFAALEALFPGSTTSDAPTLYPGTLSLFFSQIYTLDGGSISMLTPGGSVNVGLSTPPASFGITKAPSQLGLVAQQTGNINSVSYGDFSVNESRVFAADGGDIMVWSTDGNVDAGRGAKTAISAPAPTITFNAEGQVQTTFPAALVGSGIQALATTPGISPGDVDLYAPRGVVNAGDAGIVAGNLTIGATAVLGRDNITVSGVSVGVPVDSSGLGASLAGSSSVASSAANSAVLGVDSAEKAQTSTPLAASALGFLDVFVIGMGEDTCRPEDIDCLKRQKPK